MPDVDLDDPNLDARRPPSAGGVKPSEARPKAPARTKAENDSMLESMVEQSASLEIDDDGNWNFNGNSSGYSFLRAVRFQFGNILGPEYEATLKAPLRFPPVKKFPGVESPKSSLDSPLDSSLLNTHDLPNKDCARLLSSDAMDEGCALLRFVHQPTYYEMFDRIYDVPQEEWGTDEVKFLPLLYTVLAYGTMFGQSDNSKLKRSGYAEAIEQG